MHLPLLISSLLPFPLLLPSFSHLSPLSPSSSFRYDPQFNMGTVVENLDEHTKVDHYIYKQVRVV